MDEPKVWIRERKCKDGTTTYHLRWIDEAEHCWKSKKAGTDRTHAEREAGILQKELRQGTYREIKRVSWPELVEAFVASLPGERHRAMCKQTLDEFGEMMNVSPRQITSTTVKAYVAKLKEKKTLSPATVNKRVRYLRMAFLNAVEDGFMSKSPIGKKWRWEVEDDPLPREVTPEEEGLLLAKAEELEGWAFRVFIETALATGGRRSEILGLSWERIELEGDDPAVVFAHEGAVRTKGRKSRRVPILPEFADVLLRLKAQTLQGGGPFRRWTDSTIDKAFQTVANEAGVKGVVLHDLRKTFVTRLIRANVELTAVQRLAGHAHMTTTLVYYNAVHSAPDLRAAVATQRKGAAG
jgi:integrase